MSTTSEVAKYIINFYETKQYCINNLRLQTILYLSWIDYYVRTRRILFEESFIAWKCGAVVEDVYYEYCCYGGNPIICNQEDIILIDIDLAMFNTLLLEYMYIPLVYMTEYVLRMGGAWNHIWNDGIGIKKTIPKYVIKHFERGFALNCKT